MTTTTDDTWGYAAIAAPSQLFYQGFFVPDPETVKDEIAKLRFLATLPEATAAAVECLMNKDTGRLAVFLAAVARFGMTKYFVIEATEITSEGIGTNFIALDECSSAAEARDEINKRYGPYKALRAMKGLLDGDG